MRTIRLEEIAIYQVILLPTTKNLITQIYGFLGSIAKMSKHLQFALVSQEFNIINSPVWLDLEIKVIA